MEAVITAGYVGTREALDAALDVFLRPHYQHLTYRQHIPRPLGRHEGRHGRGRGPGRRRNDARPQQLMIVNE